MAGWLCWLPHLFFNWLGIMFHFRGDNKEISSAVTSLSSADSRRGGGSGGGELCGGSQ